jgi:type IV pilus assembly protein PilV
MQLNAMPITVPRPRRLRGSASPTGQAGFTLIELLVTMTVVAVGLLGLAKLQAAAVSETGTSRVRSVVAMQAESLASAIRANRGYWSTTTCTGSTTPAFSFTTTSTAASTCSAIPATSTCISTVCSPAAMAYYDLNTWFLAFHARFPAASGTMTCAATSGPMTCDLVITWTENVVGVNRNTADSGAEHAHTDYMYLHIEP